MPGSRSSNNNEAEHKSSPRENISGDDSEDESEILEESPCGRWLKRKEEVSELYERTNEQAQKMWHLLLYAAVALIKCPIC